jgi:hypothetical protein
MDTGVLTATMGGGGKPMTTYADQAATEPGVPTIPAQPQRTPTRPQPDPVDHVRTHGRECWWNLDECRWECRRG